MTNEQLRQNAAAMLAFADGKPIEFSTLCVPDSDWMEVIDPAWSFGSYEYRPKPEPVTVPWSMPEHVPGPICWLREPSDPNGMSMIVGIDNYGIDNIFGDEMTSQTWKEIEGNEYSTDRKTWKPCTVTQ